MMITTCCGGASVRVCLILRAAIEENAYNRMKKVVKWYISGFYKKPKVRDLNI